MSPLTNATRFVTVAFCVAIAGCASPDPVAYSAIASSAQLAPNRNDDTGRIPYRYSNPAPVQWRAYSRVVLDPVVIYRGSDHHFADMSEADKTELASYMQEQLSQKLAQRFTLARDPAPNTLRIRVTLTGAATNTAVLATLSRFDIAGGLYNGVQAVRGGEGTMTGSVDYAVEIYDAGNHRLLDAFVSKQYPNPYNLGASMGALAAARAGIEKGADALVAQLR